MKDLIVLILAAGDSDRFWPITSKYNLNFLGKPLAYYQLQQLERCGFFKIIIIVNEQNSAFFSHFKLKFPKLDITIVGQTLKSGMAGAILSAKKYILGNPLLILNQSDVFEDLLFVQLVKMIKGDPDGIIAGTLLDTYFPGGYITVRNDKVVSIVEKPDPQFRPSNIVKFVFDYFKSSYSFIRELEQLKTSADDRYEQALDKVLTSDLTFKFLSYKGFWGYLKYPWHILNLASYYLGNIYGQKIKKASIHKSAVISGSVLIEDGVKILENTKIVGPSYIGPGTVIGQNCLVRESIIGANCVVGYSTEIARSYIGDNCWFHTNYIGDSVVSTNVSMGAGTVLANFKLNEGSIKSKALDKRLDTGKVKLGSMVGTGVRIGVNASVMPGIKIGKNCFVGAGVILNNDLPDGKSCFLTSSNYIVKPNKIILPKDSRKSTFAKLKLS